MQTPEELAREAMGNVAGPMRRIFGGDVMARELLDALDVLVEQEVEQLADLIRARDAEVRADERAKVLAEHGVTVEHRVRRGVHSVRLVSPWEPTP